MLNVVALQGRLGRDPEIRQTTTGKQVATFTLACDRGRKDANGNKMNPADYNGNTSLEPGEPWPNCIYEKIPCTNNIRVWWDTDDQTSKWTDKWYLTPISRDEINKGYGLNQNPGW